MTDRLLQIKRRISEATKGPWHRECGSYVGSDLEFGEETGQWSSNYIAEAEREEDAEFIGESHGDMTYLLELVDKLREENDKYKEALEKIAQGDTWVMYPHDIAAYALGWHDKEEENDNDEK